MSSDKFFFYQMHKNKDFSSAKLISFELDEEEKKKQHFRDDIFLPNIAFSFLYLNLKQTKQK
jgi:hypothetical protein